MRRTRLLLWILSYLTAPLAWADGGTHSEAERRLAERLFAPCCYLQTLDSHDSPLARQLRIDIRERLSHGESPESIEHELVARYGERIRALPPGFSSNLVGATMGATIAALGLGLILRWRRRLRSTPEAFPPASPLPAKTSEWEDRLDDELCTLDV